MKPHLNPTSNSTVHLERNPAVKIQLHRTRILASVLPLLLVCLGALAFPDGLLAQGGPGSGQALASQNLTGYTHMFIAYFICWAIVLGWAVSIFRRLGRVEQALKD